MRRVRFGTIHADSLTMQDAIESIGDLVASGAGGFVVTPNVDHVVLAEESAELQAAYADASLSLVDGMPLLWLSRFFGHRLPEKISGSDLVEPLVARAAKEGWGVFLLGGVEGVGDEAARIWKERYPGLKVVGVSSPPLGFEKAESTNTAVLEALAAAKPDLIFVALGCPKQELWVHQNAKHFAPAVALGIGASLDFVAGKVKRAPAFLSRVGLEWAYRLAQEPRRMVHRYLVRDRAIVPIAWRTYRLPQEQRVYDVSAQAVNKAT